jgi:VIT1/CCC1 family predicted Fe2+/Mn2+ transporter
MIVLHEPDSHRLSDVTRHYLGDLIYGANDGLITTFTIVSGVAGARLSTSIILIIGLVNLLADGFSMGASNFLAIRSASLVDGRDRGVREPVLHGLATFAAFVVVGAVPLFFAVSFAASAVATGAALFGIGAARALVIPVRRAQDGETAAGRPRGTWMRSGLEMLAIGATAAAVAYGVGVLAARFVTGS